MELTSQSTGAGQGEASPLSVVHEQGSRNQENSKDKEKQILRKTIFQECLRVQWYSSVGLYTSFSLQQDQWFSSLFLQFRRTKK